MQVDTRLQQFSIGSQTHSQAVVSIVETQSHHSSLLMESTVNERVEHQLRVTLVVLDVCIEADMTLSDAPSLTIGTRQYLQVDGVNQVAVGHKRMDVAAAVESCLRRHSHVEIQLLVADVVLA